METDGIHLLDWSCWRRMGGAACWKQTSEQPDNIRNWGVRRARERGCAQANSWQKPRDDSGGGGGVRGVHVDKLEKLNCARADCSDFDNVKMCKFRLTRFWFTRFWFWLMIELDRDFR